MVLTLSFNDDRVEVHEFYKCKSASLFLRIRVKIAFPELFPPRYCSFSLLVRNTTLRKYLIYEPVTQLCTNSLPHEIRVQRSTLLNQKFTHVI